MIGTLSRTRAFSALRWPNFRLFWTGMVISLVGMWVMNTAQSYLVWELTRSPLATSLPIFFFSLPTLIFSPLGGVIADRVDRRRLLMVTQTLFMTQSAVLTALTWFDVVRVEHIYVLAFLNGLVVAVDNPARQAMIVRLVGRDDVSNAVGLQSLAFNASRVVGPPLGGLLYAAVGPELAFLANTLSFTAILYPLWLMDVPHENGGVRTTVWGDLLEGIAYVRGHPVVRTLIELVALIGVFGFSYVVLMPVMTSQVLEGGPAENGYLLGVLGIGATAGSLFVATMGIRGRPGRRILKVGALAAISIIGFSFSRSMLVSAAVLFVVGGSIIAFLSTANATIQMLVPDSLRGRVMSIYSAALIGSGPLNSLFAGGLGSAFGAPAAIAISAVFILLPIAYLWVRSRSFLDFVPAVEPAVSEAGRVPRLRQAQEPVRTGRPPQEA
jgi:MFS family permease